MRRFSTVRSAPLAVLALQPLWAFAAAVPAPGELPDGFTDQTVIASIGRTPITYGEVREAGKASLDGLAIEHQHQLNRLNADYAQSYHRILEEQLNALLDHRALELETATRHTTAAALLANIKPPAATDEEARAYYVARKDRVNQPFEELRPAILEYLSNQKRAAATRAFYDSLRTRYGISESLPPYRVAVAASGPGRGAPSAAAVTIVEFADFQCPFCQRAEPALRAVLAAHPNEVRLVFRNLPLSDLHPNAIMAARAGMCAEQQHLFWPMHDAMFADQSALGADALRTTASSVGLDADRFARCLADEAATLQTLTADLQAAGELGLDSTPYFFVNGRPQRGLVTSEQLDAIVNAEIKATQQARR